ncbi:MAG: hypothetical protein VR64_05885 [Desulfatitalea sp. BRH_c12]|nr:MAG: hypothetical protein VR64_05885 [Desulfatitalea sp. BRH_c12]
MIQTNTFFNSTLLPIMIGILLVMIGTIVPSRAEVVDRIVAIVNEDIILLSEMEQAAESYREMLKESGYPEDQPLTRDQRSQLLDKMINDKLTDQEVKRQGITIKDEEVDRTIDRLKQVNQTSHEDLVRLLKLRGMSFEEYRAQIKEQLLQSRIVNREVKSKIVITEDDVNAYYEAHKAQYTGQTKYHLRHILMQLPSNASDERSRVYQQMQELHRRLQAGEDFSSLAKIYSQAATAEEGGDLGLFENRLLTDEIRNVLSGLTSGQFTPVVETEQGYQIFYVQEVIHTAGKDPEEVRAEIQDKLFAEVVEQKFAAWFKELRKRAHVEILD